VQRSTGSLARGVDQNSVRGHGKFPAPRRSDHPNSPIEPQRTQRSQRENEEDRLQILFTCAMNSFVSTGTTERVFFEFFAISAVRSDCVF
jgi:hypothetical protein